MKETDRAAMGGAPPGRGLDAPALAPAPDNDMLAVVTRAFTSALKTCDPHIFLHSDRVARYAFQIAAELQLPPPGQREIYLAGLLHDLGKIGVAFRTLHKPDRPTPAEWEQIRQHPVLGFQILKDFPEFAEISIMVLYHHEWFNGQGYPDGLRGKQIPLGARILCVADSFDAMTSERPYRPAMSQMEARHELVAMAGKQFDPEVVDALLRRLTTSMSP
ncbi:MAG: HD-GYP domain-containing protein [Firmicutes bacterium]|nr:HD-GYP domain-containing protein [Bacillota bacterium]